MFIFVCVCVCWTFVCKMSIILPPLKYALRVNFFGKNKLTQPKLKTMSDLELLKKILGMSNIGDFQLKLKTNKTKI